jgi:hypothetical protein
VERLTPSGIGRPPSKAIPQRSIPRRSRRGVTLVIAMLFTVLFATLAIGFYTATTLSAQIARNERRITEAQHGIDSGMQFMRYKLGQVSIPADTTDANMPAKIEAALTSLLEGTGNLGSGRITRSGSTISIPPIALGPDTTFAATVQWVNPVARMVVTATAGPAPYSISRRVQVDFTLQSSPGAILNYGVASQGAVQLKASSSTQVQGTPYEDASIMSAYTGSPSITTGSGAIEGKLTVTSSKSQVSLGGGDVGKQSGSANILAHSVNVLPPPEFPVVDTTVFRQYAVNTYTSGKSSYKNTRVPPNTDPKFKAGDVIEGILYVESPNTVEFRGHATVNGVIVFEGKGTEADNVLDFRGNVSPSSIPDTAEFTDIRKAAKGLAILAPTAAVTMSGSTDATLSGSLIAYSVTLGGSADLFFHQGSIISLGPDPTKLEGKLVKIAGTAADNPPTTGVAFSGNFRMTPTTYRELQ